MHTRGSERATLRRKLEAQVNIHMPAPRRIGKTWTINRLAEDLRKDGWLVVELDVQGCAVPEQFARDLCQRIQRQLPATTSLTAGLKKRIGNLIGGNWDGDPFDAIGKLDLVEFLEALIEELSKEHERSAIFVDEIAFFVLAFAENDPDGAKEFFYKIRRLQSAHRKVRWLLTGSIGLNVIAARHGLEGAFVDLETFVLHPFTKEEARSFLRDATIQVAFNHRFNASDEDLDFMFKELGWLAPYYLKLVANEVHPSGAADEGVLTATRADFESAFERLLEPGRKADFAVWKEHVDKNLPKPDREAARKVLDRLAQAVDGETLDTLHSGSPPTTRRQLRDVLAILEIDGLVQKFEDRYRFRSGLIRRYWKEYEAE